MAEKENLKPKEEMKEKKAEKIQVENLSKELSDKEKKNVSGGRRR